MCEQLCSKDLLKNDIDSLFPLFKMLQILEYF